MPLSTKLSKIINSLFGNVSDKKITLLGWAFKKDTNDSRESAAIYVANILIENGAKICVYDPRVTEQQILLDLDKLNSRSSEENRTALSYFSSHIDACKESSAIAIITEWDEFKDYNWEQIYNMVLKPAKVFDGRNILNKKLIEDIGFDLYVLGNS